MSELTRVMGPGGSQGPQFNYMVPPKLNEDGDKFEWRNDVRDWMNMIRLYAQGGDNRAKGAVNALGYTLYMSLDKANRTNIDEAIEQGTMKLVAKDGEDKVDQEEAVDKILHLVAKDSATDGIRRLVKMTQDIYACKRKEDEAPATFAKRFRGLAKKYLNHCYAENSTQDSQNFAMLLLENAFLPSSTFNNIVTQLITKASSRATNTLTCMMSVPKDEITQLEAKEKKFKDCFLKWKEDNSENSSDVSTEILDSIQDLTSIVKNITSTTRNKSSRKHKEDRSAYKITLDDTVEALGDIKADEATNRAIQRKCKVDSTDPKELGSGIDLRTTLLAKRKFFDASEVGQDDFKRSKVYIPPGTGKKLRFPCKACGGMGHWRNDKECPKYNSGSGFVRRYSDAANATPQKHSRNVRFDNIDDNKDNFMAAQDKKQYF